MRESVMPMNPSKRRLKAPKTIRPDTRRKAAYDRLARVLEVAPIYKDSPVATSEFPTEIRQFMQYVWSVHNPKSFDMPIRNLTPEDVYGATAQYLEALRNPRNKDMTWGDGDSVDRERVRDILLSFQNPKLFFKNKYKGL